VEAAAERLSRAHTGLAREGRRTFTRARERLDADRARLVRAPALLLERKRTALGALGGRLTALSPQATLGRGYAIVRAGDAVVRRSQELAAGSHVDVQLAEGAFGARVEETR
jgi:exodeoxyribonuclease VII large subunit